MAVAASIFGSKSEERGFRSIENTWGEDYVVYPQIPLSALFTPDPNWKDSSNLFFKTSVDYVLCTNEGRPIVAIDFDGLGRGFDRDGEYVQIEITQDRFRKLKFDTKLRLSQNNGFPYHIVSSEEFGFLGAGIELTVVDGIIGAVLARRDFLTRAPSFLQEHAEEIDSQPHWYRSEFIQDIMTGLEVDCDAEHSRIFRKTCEVMDQVQSITGTMHYPHRYRWFEEPKAPDVNWPPWENPEAWERRLEAMKMVEVQGCEVTLSDTPVGEVSEIAKVRNVVNSVNLAQEIADLMAWIKLLRLLQNRPRGSLVEGVAEEL